MAELHTRVEFQYLTRMMAKQRARILNNKLHWGARSPSYLNWIESQKNLGRGQQLWRHKGKHAA